ncbi:MAG: ATP-binding cassette domain-containing protein [Acidimicrobiia bacterium]|nr:ATP-binding cassette domain-containing protein [Acidimicrobiia bacterium]
MSTHEPAIATDELSKTYVVRAKAGRVRRSRREVEAVKNVSFSVQRGEMVGYLGPNGAGKSTTIKMITGILTPTSGSLQVLGLTPQKQRRRLAHRIGVVFGIRSQLWYDLPLRDSFELLHYLYRTDRDRHDTNVAAFTDRLDLGSFLDTPVRQLSLGQRRRGEVTAALLHDPDLVVLDEPTIGLDVVSKYAVRDFLRELNRERGTTVLLTTHDLDDVEQLCRRMMIIDHGQVLLDGPVSEFKAEHGTERTVVVDLTEATGALPVDRGEVIRVEGHRQWIRFDRRTTTAAAVIADVTALAPIKDLSIEEPDIEDLIHRLYRSTGPEDRR